MGDNMASLNLLSISFQGKTTTTTTNTHFKDKNWEWLFRQKHFTAHVHWNPIKDNNFKVCAIQLIYMKYSGGVDPKKIPVPARD